MRRLFPALVVIFGGLFCFQSAALAETKREFYPGGALKIEWNETGGVREGPERTDNEGGQLIRQCAYKNGIVEGESRFYDDEGRLTEIENWKGNKQQGTWTRYFPESGKISWQAKYRDGVHVGQERGYYESGEPQFEIWYDKDDKRLIEKYYYVSGVVATLTEIKDSRTFVTSFYESSQTREASLTVLKKDNSLDRVDSTQYFENGAVKSESRSYSQKDGEPTVYDKEYLSDGTLAAEATMKSGETREIKIYVDGYQPFLK
jgi:antitoxin component YwqK of YwqJK toxin-antitoxin module